MQEASEGGRRGGGRAYGVTVSLLRSAPNEPPTGSYPPGLTFEQPFGPAGARLPGLAFAPPSPQAHARASPPPTAASPLKLCELPRSVRPVPYAPSSPQKIPWVFLAGCFINYLVDGFLVGIGYVASPNTGLILALATGVENGVLGFMVSFSLIPILGIPVTLACMLVGGLSMVLMAFVGVFLFHRCCSSPGLDLSPAF